MENQVQKIIKLVHQKESNGSGSGSAANQGASGNSPQKRKFEMGSFNSMSAGKQHAQKNSLQFQLQAQTQQQQQIVNSQQN